MATEYGIRLRAARKHAKLTQMRLSEITGIPQSTISTAENLGHGSAETTVYAMACGVNAHWLATGDGEMLRPGAIDVQSRWVDDPLTIQSSGASASEFDSSISHHYPKNRVPLLQWGHLGESELTKAMKDGVKTPVETDETCSSRAFALTVENDSMVSASGYSFSPGTTLVVDPGRVAVAGDYVIARDPHNGKATFKQLTTDGARWYLKPLNAQYPTIEIDDPAMRVIGRVIEAKPPSVKL